MTAALCLPVRTTRVERLMLGLAATLHRRAVHRMRVRAATAGRDALQAAAAERMRDVSAAMHLSLLPR